MVSKSSGHLCNLHGCYFARLVATSRRLVEQSSRLSSRAAKVDMKVRLLFYNSFGRLGRLGDPVERLVYEFKKKKEEESSPVAKKAY